MTGSAVRSPPKVVLIPWDTKSTEHFQRMFDQRRACGWNLDLVEKWKEEVDEGTKCMYWVVSAPYLCSSDGLVECVAAFGCNLLTNVSRYCIAALIPFVSTPTPAMHADAQPMAVLA